MIVTYSYNFISIRTKTTEQFTDAIKKIGLILKGESDGIVFELPVDVDLGDPQPASFIEYANITKEILIGWVEQTDRVAATKDHIQMVIEKMTEETTMQKRDFPWESNNAPQ